MKRPKDLINWTDLKRRIPLGEGQWPWKPGGIQAVFVIDLRHKNVSENTSSSSTSAWVSSKTSQ